jgi:L-alanine-DL-glutamate epimerase-like enolase superfamily enzyme
MHITEIEVHELVQETEDLARRDDGESVYEPGSTRTGHSAALTVRTDTGIEGYAHSGYPGTLVDQIRHTTDDLLGRDPLERESIWQDLWHALRHTDHEGVGPIDVALWDVAGKHYDASVSELLGGHRDRIPAYASTFSGSRERDSPADYADFAAECLDAGYPGFKIHPHGIPENDVEICRAVADRVGDEMDLMLDPSSCYDTYADALRVGRVLDELDFYWYEDPLMDTGDSVYAMRRLAAELDTPLLGLEHSRTEPFGVVNHLMDDACDMVRMDAGHGGGITGAMKVAHAAEAAGMDVEPHGASLEHLHIQSAIRNTNYAEDGLVHPELTPDWRDRANDDGTLDVPQGPGVGYDHDLDDLESEAVRHEVFAL